MENVRIAILSADDTVCAFLDNEVDQALHYYDEILHTYLQGSQYTFEATVLADHDDSQYIVEGNHISFRYKDHDYYCTIVNVAKNEETIIFQAYGLTLELTNETVGEYSGTSMSIEQYIDAYGFENTFTIVVNEVSDKRISHEWTGSETILARLFSIANVFDAELEFITELNDDYSLKQITLNIYRKHDDDHQGMGEDQSGTVVRYGKDIQGITKTSDITELYTAIRPIGTDNLRISSLGEREILDKNGNQEYWHPNGNDAIYAPQARNRFPSIAMGADGDRWIMNVWSYDTDNVEMLYGQALAQLKKNCVPKVEYDIDGYIDGNIGDTYTIEDTEFKPVLYLNARIVEQEICFTDRTKCKTTFDNFTEMESQISSDLLSQMQQMIDANKTYQLIISSDNGLVLPEDIDHTVLTAFVRDGSKDVTDDFTLKWYKGQSHVYTGDSLSVSRSELDPSAVYRVDAIDTVGNVRASAEVTLAKVTDGSTITIVNTTVTYQVSSSGTAIPTGEWLDTIPTTNPGDYLWVKTVITYSDGTSSTTHSVSRNGIDGQNGQDGSDGTSITITSTSVVYQAHTSGIVTPTGSWSETVPNVGAGMFLWTKTTVTYSDGSQTLAYSVARAGVEGATGKTSYFHIKYSPVADPAPSQMTEIPDKYIGTYVDFTELDSDDPDDYTWSKFTGDNGANGTPGKNGIDGKTSYLHIAYATSADGSTGFSTTDSVNKTYIGQYVDYTEADSTDPTKYSWSKIKGDKGDTGAAGATGNGIQTITEYYAVSTSNSTAPSSWSTNVPTMTTTNKYLWNYEKITYTDGTSKDSAKRVIGVYGNTGATGPQGEKGETGATGNGIQSIVNYYLASASSSGVTTSTSGWTTTMQSTSTSKRYLWNYELITYTNGSSTKTTPVIIGTHGATGAQGQQGIPGKDGQDGTSITITSTSVTYQKSTSGTNPPSGTWTTTIPSLAQGEYLWTRTIVKYSDGKSTTSYSVSRSGIDGQDGQDGAAALSLIIESSAGQIFKNSGIATTLKARVFQGTEELTEQEINTIGAVKWYRNNSTTAVSTGITRVISEGSEESTVTYRAQLEA